MTYYDDLIHEEFIENMGHLFSNAKIVNFDIICRECRGDELKNPKSYWETIKNKILKITKMMFKTKPCHPSSNLSVMTSVLSVIF